MVARRTQGDRTAATRAAVLDATVDLLIERGYAGTSTRLAAERAGVSLGALQHHFPSKAELTVAAMRRVNERLAGEFVAHRPRRGGELDRVAAVLDRLHVVFCGPTFAASLELVVAARTDPELAGPVRALLRDADTLIATTAAELLPEMARSPDFEKLLAVAISALRGLALVSMQPGGSTDARAWEHVRDHLLATAERTLEGASP